MSCGTEKPLELDSHGTDVDKMRCNRNMKLCAIYGLAALNLMLLLYTHVLYPVENAQSINLKSQGKQSSLYGVVKQHSNGLIQINNLTTSGVKNVGDPSFGKFKLHGNISNDFEIFPQYNLLSNPSQKCKNEQGDFSDIFLLVLVSSSVRNFKQRLAIRETWASVQSVAAKKVLTLFMLGINFFRHPYYMEQVHTEYERFGDIIMEDFNDTYLNLTLKSIMGFKWMCNYCPTAKYVMKTDDDMFINLNYTVKYLLKLPSNTKRFVMGHVINGSPIRNEKSKWYMPYKIYPINYYPPFASGTCYVMSNDVIFDTYQISRRLRYIHLEDIFSAICWERLGIVPSNHRGFNLNYVYYSYCRYIKLVSVHDVKVSKMYILWKHFTEDMARLSRYYCLFNGWFF